MRPRRVRGPERQASYPDQIANGDDILRRGMPAFDSEVPAFAEAARGLRPAEDLLDLSAALLAELMRFRADFHAEQTPIRYRSRGSRVRDDAMFAQTFDKVARRVAAICAYFSRRDAALLQLGDLLDGDLRIRAYARTSPQTGRTSRGSSRSSHGRQRQASPLARLPCAQVLLRDRLWTHRHYYAVSVL